MLEFLPQNLKLYFKNININLINEIRLRVGAPVVINVNGNNKFLYADGIDSVNKEKIICNSSDIQKILLNISNNCLYSINDQLINGYITLHSGVRIGVAGEVVSVNNHIKTIKNISSLNIRIPHFVKNCSLKAFLSIVTSNKIKNSLILSPAGAGKTTFLRDLTHQLIEKLNGINILVADERCEIASGINLIENNFVNSVDVYSNCSKKFAFENGIRSMNPDVIITDELNFSSDSEIIEHAITCGVKVVASIHANNINDLYNKPNFKTILNKKMFERYIVLSDSCGPGTFEGVYDENLSRIVY